MTYRGRVHNGVVVLEDAVGLSEGLAVEVHVPAEAPACDAGVSLAALAEEIRNSVPLEEWAKLPRDGARNVDHYLYGAPKKP